MSRTRTRAASAQTGAPNAKTDAANAQTDAANAHSDAAYAQAGAAGGLAILGLEPGESVRWRAGSGGRWRTGRVTHRERDGSVAVTDARGMSRSLRVERLEVRRAGPRGGAGWEPLPDRAGRSEQLELL